MRAWSTPGGSKVHSRVISDGPLLGCGEVPASYSSHMGRVRGWVKALRGVRSTPVAVARAGSRKAARESATVDVGPAAPTGPGAAHHSAYVALAVGPSAVLGFGRTKSRYSSKTEEHPAGGQLWPEVLSRPVVVAIHEDASRTSPAPETSSDHQERCAWTHCLPLPVPIALERASLPSSPRRAAWVLYASLPSSCSPVSPYDHGVYCGIGLGGTF